jgi:hydrogenase maturation protease
MNHSRFDASDSKPKTLVIGIGNDFRGDDGAGLFVVRKLKELMPINADIFEATGEATELMALWEKRDIVILVDAVFSGSIPGTVYRYDVRKKALPASNFESRSTHAFGVLQAIELAKTLNTLPTKLIIYGIEGDSFELRTEITPEIKEAAENVIELILEEIG